MDDESDSTGIDVWDSVWIDIGNHEIVRLSQIEGVAPYDALSMVQEFNNLMPSGSVILSLVRIKGGDTLASTLTWREWRNRLRKAQHVII